jgi:hypothetical protein
MQETAFLIHTREREVYLNDEHFSQMKKTLHFYKIIELTHQFKEEIQIKQPFSLMAGMIVAVKFRIAVNFSVFYIALQIRHFYKKNSSFEFKFIF